MKFALPSPKPGKHALGFLFITVLTSMIGFGIIIPVMPRLIQTLAQTDVSGAARYGSYLMLVYAVMQFFMSPIIGGLSDRFGRRLVILISLVAYAIDYALMATAPTYSWLIIGRAIAGACAATYATSNAYIADISPPEKRAANFGMMGAAFGLGFIIGPLVGGWLGDINIRYPFYAASGLAMANAVYGFFVLPETLKKENRRPFDWRRANPLGSLIQMSRHPVVVSVLFSYFLMMFAQNSFPAIWAYFTEEKFNWNASQIGYSLGFVGLLSVMVQGGLVRLLMPKIGEVRGILIGSTAMIIALMGYALMTPSGSWVYFWIVIGSVSAFTMPSMQAIMSKVIPPNEQGELQGAIATLMSLTLMTSPFLMAQIFAHFTRHEVGATYFPGAPFLLASLLVTISLIPIILLLPRIEKAAPNAPEAEDVKL